MSDVSFRIDEKNKVVVCKITNCEDLAISRIDKYSYCGYIYNSIYDRVSYEIPNTFTGVARCNPYDKFDVEYGKKLALTRAKAKRGRAINATLYRYIKKAQRGLEDLERYGIHKVPEIEY